MDKKQGSFTKQEKELLKREVPENKEEKSEMEDIILNNFCKCESANDCTGLIPEISEKEDEDSYREVYPYAVPVRNEKDETFGAEGTHSGV